MSAKGSRDLAKYRLNTKNLSADLLNRSLTPVRHIVVSNDLKGITNVVV